MATIIRGTTPTIKYTFKTINPANIESAYLTIQQNGTTIVEKDLDDATVTADAVSWLLTQQETLNFTESPEATNPVSPAEVIMMMNWVLSNGIRGASDKTHITVESNYKNEVIG